MSELDLEENPARPRPLLLSARREEEEEAGEGPTAMERPTLQGLCQKTLFLKANNDLGNFFRKRNSMQFKFRGRITPAQLASPGNLQERKRGRQNS